jgi:hypothetical protein
MALASLAVLGAAAPGQGLSDIGGGPKNAQVTRAESAARIP